MALRFRQFNVGAFGGCTAAVLLTGNGALDAQHGEGLVSDWLENNTIKRFKLTKVRNEALELWAEESLALLELHTSSEPYLLIHDISTQAVGLLVSLRSQFDLMHPVVTVIGQARANEILKNRPDFRVRLAVIVSQAMSGQFVYRRATGTVPILPNLAVKVFFKLETALDWLRPSPEAPGDAADEHSDRAGDSDSEAVR